MCRIYENNREVFTPGRAAKVIPKLRRRLRETQRWLDEFMGQASEASLKCMWLYADIDKAQREARYSQAMASTWAKAYKNAEAQLVEAYEGQAVLMKVANSWMRSGRYNAEFAAETSRFLLEEQRRHRVTQQQLDTCEETIKGIVASLEAGAYHIASILQQEAQDIATKQQSNSKRQGAEE